MDYHLERRVILNPESEFQNLYPWSLQELGDDGSKIGRDQIPWEWTLFFTATELTYNDSLSIEPDYRKEGEDEKIAVRNRRVIRAKLQPGTPWDIRRPDDVSYSMFGTDRTIRDFGLLIENLENDEATESCAAWGGVSYTSEVDFRDETSPDSIEFYLYVRPGTFDRYASQISSGSVDRAVFRVSGVEGFYSDWSPGISTDEIKVLTSDTEHAVELPSDWPEAVPRLGKVSESEFLLQRIQKFELPQEERATDWIDDDEEDVSEPVDVPQSAVSLHAMQTVGLLASLRTAAWLMALLLLLILIT